MTRHPELQIVRVFANADGEYGNALGVVEAAPEITVEQMLELTNRFGLSETVLLDRRAGSIRIFNPVEELPFAGHPMVGAAWLLADRQVSHLECPAGQCEVAFDGDVTWVTAHIDWAPPWQSVELDSVAEVDALTGPPAGHDFVQAWAWADEAAGRVRARVFAPRVGIPEDEACGSASLLLADRLRSELVIDHGQGSVVHARALERGLAQVGGRVVLDR